MKRRLVPGKETILAQIAGQDRPQAFAFLTHDVRGVERDDTLALMASGVNAFEDAAGIIGIDPLALARAAEADPALFALAIRDGLPRLRDDGDLPNLDTRLRDAAGALVALEPFVAGDFRPGYAPRPAAYERAFALARRALRSLGVALDGNVREDLR